MMLGQICNIHSTLMESIQLGRLLVTRSPDISITSMEVTPFSTFHHHHSEDKLKTTISLSPNHSGTGMLKTEKSVGIPAVLPSSMLTTLSADISQELTASSEVNAKKETFQLKKDGH